MPYWKYAVVASPSGFTDPKNAAPFGPVTVGAPVITGDGGAVIAAESATVELP